MEKIKKILLRISSANLIKMVGEEIVEYADSFESCLLNRKFLVDLVLKNSTPRSLLGQSYTRDPIFKAMNKEETLELVEEIGLEKTSFEKMTDALAKLNYQKKSKNLEKLYKFFSIENKNENELEQVSASLEIVKPKYPLFDHQIKAAREIFGVLTSGENEKAILHMPTGSGKTRTAMHIIAKIANEFETTKNVIVWLAHSEELCDQAAEEFIEAWQMLGNKPINLIRFYKKYKADLGNAQNCIIVSSLSKLYKATDKRQTEILKLGRKIKLVVLDEAHCAVAETYSHVLGMMMPPSGQPAKLLGLTATPGRAENNNEGQTKSLINIFGKNKISLEVKGYENPVDFLIDNEFLAKPSYEIIPSEFVKFDLVLLKNLAESLEIPEQILKILANDKKRNFLILDKIIKEAKAGGKIIVYGCSVEHSKLISNLLNIKGVKSVHISSKTDTLLRKKLISTYRDTDEIQVLCNYGILSTGFDAPKTNVAVITRPTKSVGLYAQMVGRAARGRKAGGNSTCKIITVVDQIPGFSHIAEGFQFWDSRWDLN